MIRLLSKTAILFACLFLFSASSCASGAPDCSKNNLSSHPQQVLECYIHLPEAEGASFRLEGRVDTGNVVIETYQLNSQQWPKDTVLPQMENAWQHRLVLYIPKIISQRTALLVVSGGTRNRVKGNARLDATEDVIIASTAMQTKSMIAVLSDVPNQYLYFEDGIPRREDGLIAYTWKQFLHDPEKNVFWLAHLPMAKAVVKTMDAVQQIAKQKQVNINHFVITGASKRGWASWLATLADDRISAVIPVVIDILSMDENIEYIHESFNGWPDAWRDYVEQEVVTLRHTPAFHHLIDIQDPLRYLDCADCDRFRRRLSIPKYIVSASGDDFFSPASLGLYFDKLPGAKYARVIPNSGHGIDKVTLIDAVATFYKSVLAETVLPSLNWKQQNGRLSEVITDHEPASVTLWEAMADTRDFRYRDGKGPHYASQPLQGGCISGRCVYQVPDTKQGKRWRASFVEVRYPAANSVILTTPAFVSEIKSPATRH